MFKYVFEARNSNVSESCFKGKSEYRFIIAMTFSPPPVHHVIKLFSVENLDSRISAKYFKTCKISLKILVIIKLDSNDKKSQFNNSWTFITKVQMFG